MSVYLVPSLLITVFFVSLVYWIFRSCPAHGAPTIPNPPAPPESVETLTSPDREWMMARFPVFTRIDYLNHVLLVSRHSHPPFLYVTCDYIDSNGHFRDFTLNIDQIRAIAKRDDSPPQ